ncbi:MAG: alpha/beta fold hydrolase BchO [Sphingomonadales bacterium]
MEWEREAPSWPNASVSRFVSVDGTRWHLQEMGNPSKPRVLLLHGAGATTHSYADVMPVLANDFAVTAIDLPGHGFTTMLGSSRPTREGVSEGVAALLEKEALVPDLIVGHSAGGAVAVTMVAEGLLSPTALIVINGSFFPFPGPAEYVFPALAKMLFLNPFVPRIFANSAASRRRGLNLINSTGSDLTEEQISLYQRALTSSAHVEGTLAMMANWDLAPIEGLLRSLDLPVLQIIGGRDKTVRPSGARKIATYLKHGAFIEFETCGHLVHEEMPAEVSDAIRVFAQKTKILLPSKRLIKST